MHRPEEHFAALFRPLIEDFGPIDEHTATGIAGFAEGGPVALCTIDAARICLTCELSLYGEQLPGAEGMRYELFTRDLAIEDAQPLLTALGNLSFEAEVGDMDAVDVSSLSIDGITDVQLRLFCRATVMQEDFAVYEAVALRSKPPRRA